jgi:hypothetical protein
MDSEHPYSPPQANLVTSPDLESESRPIPFEDPERYPGLWLRYKETIVQGFRENQAFLERVPQREGLSKPWQFQLLSALPMMVFVLLILIPLLALGLMGGVFGAKETMVGGGILAGIVLGVLILGPIFIFIGMLIMGALDHFCLWMWGGTKAGVELEQTIRAVGYAQGILNLVQLPLQILSMIPILGALFSLANLALMVAFFVYIGLALARMHRTDAWRGLCAVFTPMLLCCCLGFIALIVVFSIKGFQ